MPFPPRGSRERRIAGCTSRQRVAIRQGILDPERRERLVALGFEPELVDSRWAAMFSRLETQVQRTGPVPPRRNEPRLRAWFGQQVERQRRGRLSAEREARFGKLGLTFERQPTWDDRFAELVRRKAAQQTPLPPALGAWLQKQLALWEEGVLETRRRQSLEELGYRGLETSESGVG